jgi:hypothetical protein
MIPRPASWRRRSAPPAPAALDDRLGGRALPAVRELAALEVAGGLALRPDGPDDPLGPRVVAEAAHAAVSLVVAPVPVSPLLPGRRAALLLAAPVPAGSSGARAFRRASGAGAAWQNLRGAAP